MGIVAWLFKWIVPKIVDNMLDFSASEILYDTCK